MTQYKVCAGEYCGCESSDSYDPIESRLLQMTFWAHRELLFDKIKQRIEKEEGENLEKIADLLIDASKSKWKNDSDLEKKKSELRDKLKETFEE